MKSFTTNRIVFAIGASVLGIILLIWPGTSLIIMAKCIGAAVAIGGLFAAYQFFRDHDSAVKSLLLVMASVMIICGVVIFLHPEELVKLIPMIMGILVLLSGIINLGETFTLSRQRYNRWWLSLIIAVLTIGAGIFLITRAFSLAALITRIAGGILLFDGLSDLWVISRVSRADKDAQAVDVKAEEVKTEAAPGQASVEPESSAPVSPAADTEAKAPVQKAPDTETAVPVQPAPDQTASAPVQTEINQEPEAAAPEKSADRSEAEPASPDSEPYKPELSFGEEETPAYMNQEEQDGEYKPPVSDSADPITPEDPDK